MTPGRYRRGKRLTQPGARVMHVNGRSADCPQLSEIGLARVAPHHALAVESARARLRRILIDADQSIEARVASLSPPAEPHHRDPVSQYRLPRSRSSHVAISPDQYLPSAASFLIDLKCCLGRTSRILISGIALSPAVSSFASFPSPTSSMRCFISTRRVP